MFLSTFFLPISTEGWKCDFFCSPQCSQTKVLEGCTNVGSAFYNLRLDSDTGSKTTFALHTYTGLWPNLPLQTKIWEGRTNLPECVFEALFKGVSHVFGLRIVEKCSENPFGKVGSTFPNLRLGSIKLTDTVTPPKSSFGEHNCRKVDSL